MSNLRFVATLFLLIGCQDAPATGLSEEDLSLRPPSIPSRTLYPDVNGELYPDDPAFKASIDTKSAAFTSVCDLPNHGCVVTLGVRHTGLWNGSEQIISLVNDGAANPPYTAEKTETCLERGAGNTQGLCFKKELVYSRELVVPCSVEIGGNVQHRAWWFGFWGASVAGGPLTLQTSPFRIGEVVLPSFLSRFKAPACLEPGGGGGGSGGGGGGSSDCVHYYGVWSDPDTGEIVRKLFLFSICGGLVQ